MKILLLKDCKDGKAETIVRIGDKRGLYLINKGEAVSIKSPGKRPLNKSATRKIRKALLKEQSLNVGKK